MKLTNEDLIELVKKLESVRKATIPYSTASTELQDVINTLENQIEEETLYEFNLSIVCKGAQFDQSFFNQTTDGVAILKATHIDFRDVLSYELKPVHYPKRRRWLEKAFLKQIKMEIGE